MEWHPWAGKHNWAREKGNGWQMCEIRENSESRDITYYRYIVLEQKAEGMFSPCFDSIRLGKYYTIHINQTLHKHDKSNLVESE